MDKANIYKLAFMFEKAAQGCILEPGQSTMSISEAKLVAKQILEELDNIDPILLAQYPSENLVLVMKELASGSIPDAGQISQAIAEAKSGIGSFHNIFPFMTQIKRMNCIM